MTTRIRLARVTVTNLNRRCRRGSGRLGPGALIAGPGRARPDPATQAAVPGSPWRAGVTSIFETPHPNKPIQERVGWYPNQPTQAHVGSHPNQPMRDFPRISRMAERGSRRSFNRRSGRRLCRRLGPSPSVTGRSRARVAASHASASESPTPSPSETRHAFKGVSNFTTNFFYNSL